MGILIQPHDECEDCPRIVLCTVKIKAKAIFGAPYHVGTECLVAFGNFWQPESQLYRLVQSDVVVSVLTKTPRLEASLISPVPTGMPFL